MKENKEHVTVSLHLKVDGKLKRLKKKTYYGRKLETSCFTLDDFANIVFSWDKIMNTGSTYAYDGLMQEMEKKLPKKENETAESVFLKYWVKSKETINKKFLEINKGGLDELNPFFPAENDYLKYCISNLCGHFDNQPIPVQYGFLYWFYKYVENSSIKDIEKDLNMIPDEIKNMVDKFIVNNESKS